MQKIKTLFQCNILQRAALLYGLLWGAVALSAQAPVALRPAQLLSDTVLLQQYWQADAALDLTAYTPAELQLQRWYNRELAHEFVLSQRFVPDEERYTNNNYKLPLHQRHIDNEDITPYTWKWVGLEVKEPNGGLLIAKLRRPIWWLQATGTDKIGNAIQLDLPELEIKGTALVTAIWPSYVDTRVLDFPSLGSQCYRPITGWFQRQTSEVWSLAFANGDTIGTTPTHPFYSLDQQVYVSAGKLQIGEHIQTTKGNTTLLSKAAQAIQKQWVYNLEVWRDHNFYVGTEGELVHNSCAEIFRRLCDIDPELRRSVKPYLKTPGYKADIKDVDKSKILAKYGLDQVCFDDFGFPDFMPFVKKIKGVEGIVKINVTGNSGDDIREANKAMAKKLGLAENTKFDGSLGYESDGIRYTWHHHQDGKHMILVPSDVNGVSHAGGASLARKDLQGTLPDPWHTKKNFTTKCL